MPYEYREESERRHADHRTGRTSGHHHLPQAGELSTVLDGISELLFDLDKLEYISSAGLRVLLAAQKNMAKHGNMEICNVKPEIMEIFEVTGFVDIMNIRE